MTEAHRIMARDLMNDARALLGTDAAFGDRKVFLSALLGPIAGQDMTELEECRRLGLLSFARADLVGAMDADMVDASTWTMDGCTYHFLIVE